VSDIAHHIQRIPEIVLLNPQQHYFFVRTSCSFANEVKGLGIKKRYSYSALASHSSRVSFAMAPLYLFSGQ